MRYLGFGIFVGLFFIVSLPAHADCDRTEGCYGAVAAGLWHNSSGNPRVAAGSAVNHPSEIAAENAAMKKCNENGYNCKVIGTFKNGGCGYISVGKSYDSVKWGSGATPNEALRQCRQGGHSCDTPIGGCTAAPEVPSNDPDEELGD